MFKYIFSFSLLLIQFNAHAVDFTEAQNYVRDYLNNHFSHARLQTSKACTVQASYESGFANCASGHPSMLLVELVCDNTSNGLRIDDPEYFFCPPAKWIDNSLGKGHVNAEEEKFWKSIEVLAGYPSFKERALRTAMAEFMLSKGFKKLDLIQKSNTDVFAGP